MEEGEAGVGKEEDGPSYGGGVGDVGVYEEDTYEAGNGVVVASCL